jgi:hypothetical protein
MAAKNAAKVKSRHCVRCKIMKKYYFNMNWILKITISELQHHEQLRL